MILTIALSLVLDAAHAGPKITTSRGAACAALLGADPEAFKDALAAELSTREARAAFLKFRRDVMKVADDAPITTELLAPTAFVTNSSAASDLARAAALVRTVERVASGKRSIDEDDVDFDTENLRLGFVRPDAAAIRNYLADAKAALGTANDAERIRAGQRKPVPDLAESTVVKMLFPKSGLLKTALLLGAPALGDLLFRVLQQTNEFPQWLDALDEVARSGDAARWAFLTISTQAAPAFVTAAARGRVGAAAEMHHDAAYLSLARRDGDVARGLKDLAIDVAVFNEERGGAVVPTLALMLRYQAPRPNDNFTEPSKVWQSLRAHLDSILK